MDIPKILRHSVELLKLRNEETKDFEKELFEYQTNRFYSEIINVNTKNISVIYAFSKESFKDFWSNIRNKSVDEIKEEYGKLKIILILNDYPSSITYQALQKKELQLAAEEGFIQIFLMQELMYNPTKHELVPKHEKMNNEDVKVLMENLKLKAKTQLPFIQKTDVIARWLGIQSGDVVKITRYSPTSGKSYYYRCCI
jgi:DNA-directed RNA polymerase subunit H (RpoH/RPB5)